MVTAVGPRTGLYGLVDVLLTPLGVIFLLLIMMHIVISLVLPLRWQAIRGTGEHLEARLQAELEKAYGPVPREVAKQLLEERKEVDRLLREVQEVGSWLQQREQSANIEELYGRNGNTG